MMHYETMPEPNRPGRDLFQKGIGLLQNRIQMLQKITDYSLACAFIPIHRDSLWPLELTESAEKKTKKFFTTETTEDTE